MPDVIDDITVSGERSYWMEFDDGSKRLVSVSPTTVVFPATRETMSLKEFNQSIGPDGRIKAKCLT